MDFSLQVSNLILQSTLFIKSMCSRIKKNRDSIAKHMKILYNDKKMNCKLIVRILSPIL